MTTHATRAPSAHVSAPKAKKNRKQVRVYLDTEEDEMLTAIVGATEGKLSESDVMTMILSAALKSIRDNDYRFPIPLRFKVPDGADIGRHPSRGYVLKDPKGEK
jgi:hypothetical protein